MASSFKCIYNYPETLLDTLCTWNDTILAGSLDINATNFTDAIGATSSSDRSRAKEMYRIGLLRLELTKGEGGLNHIKSGKNAQSDLGFISSIIAQAKSVEDTESLKLAYSALCSIYSLLQSITIGQTEISLNALIYRLNDIYPCPSDIDFIKWHRYVLSAFLCELRYKEHLHSKDPVKNPIPKVFEDTLTGKNVAPFSMSIRTNESKNLTLRKTIQSVSDVKDAIASRVSLTDIFQQKMPLFMFGNDSDAIPKGFYGMAHKYFSKFLRAAFIFEVSDSDKPSRLDALFNEDNTSSAKTNALKEIINIFESSSDILIKKEFNNLMKTIYQGAKDALKILSKNQSQQQFSSQIIYYGCPGTGKSFKVKENTEGIDGEDAIYFNTEGKRIPLPATKIERANTPSNVFRTTFHPDYDYSTFIGTYKPIMKPVYSEDCKSTKEELTYDFVPQVFTNAYIRAYKSLEDDTLVGPDKNVYLIIEEINRGNCAQIFGDLFQLLDRTDGYSDYSVTPDTELKDYLYKQGIKHDKLRLPANLHIYATMNTSDQSLFPMDSAFKRRWAMEYIPIKLQGNDAENYVIHLFGKEYKWVEFLEKVNKLIRIATDSEDKQMGEFFVKSPIIKLEEFRNKVMFYIWNDVCKDHYNASKINSVYFMRDAEDKMAFTFAELFGDGRKNQKDMPDRTPEELIMGFMDDFLKLNGTPIDQQ